MSSIKKKLRITLTTILFLFCSIHFANAQTPFQIKDKWGLKDTKGKVIVEPKYNDIRIFMEGLACVSLISSADQKTILYGFIDKKGKEVIPIKYSEAGSFRQGRADVKMFNEELQAYKCGFINKAGKEVIPLTFDDVNGFNDEGYANVRIARGKGVIDTTGKIIIPCVYGELVGIVNGFTTATLYNGTKPKKDGILNIKGEIVVPFIYDRIGGWFVEGLCIVANKNPDYSSDDNDEPEARYGFVDQTGKLIIPLIYDEVEDFKNGKAKVKVGEKEFYINKKGGKI
jgi:WG containing repeat